MYTRNADYELWLHDASGARVKLLTPEMWVKLQFARRIGTVGSFEIELAESALPAHDYPDFTDWRVVAWRRPAGRRQGIAFAGLARSWERKTSGNQERLFLRGADYNHLLMRRIVAYAAGTAYTTKTGYADDVMKALVRENLGSLAATARQMSIVTVEANRSAGTSISKGCAWQPLFQTLREISESSRNTPATAVYFDMVPTGDGSTCTFITNVPQLGMDHRYPGGAQGPVWFSLELGNMQNPRLSISRDNEATYAYGGGQGEESARIIIETGDTARVGASPLNRIELFYDGRQYDATESTALASAAKSRLEDAQPVTRFAFDSVDTYDSSGNPLCVYGVHWGLGDRVTAQYLGQSFDMHVAAVGITVDSSGEKITGTFEEVLA